MNEQAKNHSKIYFEGKYSYRKPAVLILGIIALLVGLGAFLSCFFEEPNDSDWWGKITLTFTVSTVMLVCGFVSLKHWKTNYTATYKITDQGIQFASKFYTWDKIKWVSVQNKAGKLYLFFQTKGFSFDYVLAIENPLELIEYDNILVELDDEVGKEYPNVHFGD